MLQAKIAEDLSPISMDRQQMEQALLNILTNALEAQGEGGSVRTWTETSDTGRPALVVEDDGPGIAPEVADALFTPFFTTKKDGQGIGLTMVREILNNHGFDYALESPPGEPTRFTIWF
jgi:signal transduction histidine kinase